MVASGQIVFIVLMRATSRTDDGDPFDSSLFWWLWLILIVTGYLVSRWRPGPPPLFWTTALIGPLVVAVALLATGWHDPDDGASFWILGEMYVLALGGFAFVAAHVGSERALRRRFGANLREHGKKRTTGRSARPRPLARRAAPHRCRRGATFAGDSVGRLRRSHRAIGATAEARESPRRLHAVRGAPSTTDDRADSWRLHARTRPYAITTDLACSPQDGVV